MFLYTVAIGYPNNPSPHEKNSVKQLLYSLKDLLPCTMCRANFNTKMSGPLGERLDAAVECSETLVQYVYDLESAVAVTNNKTPPDKDVVMNRVMTNTYTPASTGVAQSKDMTVLWVLLLVVVTSMATLITWSVTRKVAKNKIY